MTEHEAQTLLAQIATTHRHRIACQVVEVGRGNSKARGLRLILRPGQRTITIARARQWESVASVWALFFEEGRKK